MTLDEARLEVAEASRVLAGEGILDGFGHVSRRSPERPDIFLMSRSLAPALVTPSDIVELDLNGEAVAGGGAKLFVERFIHSEIYRQNPDVHAVVHSHAMAVLPFAVVPTARVRPLIHMCGFLEGTPAPFEIADHAGPGTDLLIRSRELGAALADHLGRSAVVLMRGHGFTATGPTVPDAVFRAVYSVRNCEVQLTARVLGEPVYLSSEEAHACDRMARSVTERAWTLWRVTHASNLAG